MSLRTVLVFLMLSLTGKAYAFPELIRHGYTQCTACHFSPSGGGVLTPYGRQLAGELLSTWSYKGEAEFAHGLNSDDLSALGLHFGGDARAVQIHRKNSRLKEGRFFLMQANIDAAFNKGPFTVMISVGEIEEPMSGVVQGNLHAARYYGLLNVTDSVAVRAGRFLPQYGINMADHTVGTRSGIGFRPGYQLDTVEVSYLGETWTVFLAQARALPTFATGELVRSAHVAYAFKERYKLGVSHWYSQTSGEDIRRLYGVNGLLGFTPKWFSLFEVDWSHEAQRDGAFGLGRLGYEILKGVWPYLQYERRHSNLEDSRSMADHYTAGMQIFPRPHFEVAGQWAKVKTSDEWADQAYLLIHYYF